ncbi:hypothetical protein C8N42_1263 [Celeribacter persicus]|uniref:Uncharacterized protein n=1 Tax=Celeribacter persicus TaxID=1651082 RepID=A0A2T5H4E8_9RHOB|nr:hypothetical protein C8N42_1263 [Celeribacter persicus]
MLEDWEAQIRADPAFYQWLREAEEIGSEGGATGQVPPPPHAMSRASPFSLRLSKEERTRLESQAGAMPLATYIKSVVLTENAPRYRKRRKPWATLTVVVMPSIKATSWLQSN